MSRKGNAKFTSSRSISSRLNVRYSKLTTAFGLDFKYFHRTTQDFVSWQHVNRYDVRVPLSLLFFCRLSFYIK